MARPLKYLRGERIQSLNELADLISAGRYLIVADTGQRVHPGWAASWQLNMAINAIRRRSLCHAIPNPDHPDHKEAQT